VRKDTKNTETKKTLQRTQIQFFKLVAVPMLTYASENLTIIRLEKGK
jgi:hypothetical protein